MFFFVHFFFFFSSPFLLFRPRSARIHCFFFFFAFLPVGIEGEVLEDNVIGTDEAREAKIEDTLRKMGVQSIGEIRAAKAKEVDQSAAPKITSFFEVRVISSGASCHTYIRHSKHGVLLCVLRFV